MPEAGLDGRMVDVSGGAAFLLCRGASRLTSHAAQWALPGGRVDPGETAVDAGPSPHLTTLFEHTTFEVAEDPVPRHIVLVQVPGNRTSPSTMK
jgi:hypothetical protein